MPDAIHETGRTGLMVKGAEKLEGGQWRYAVLQAVS